jgi:hypothetical protein
VNQSIEMLVPHIVRERRHAALTPIQTIVPTPAPILSTSRAVVKTQTDASKKTLATTDPILARDAASSETEHRHAIIAEAAYLRAEQRHFEPGHDVEDWLAVKSPSIGTERWSPPLPPSDAQASNRPLR